MQFEKDECFKLDEIDRKVLAWFIDNVSNDVVKCWLDFVADSYKRNNTSIDTLKLYEEILTEKSWYQSVGVSCDSIHAANVSESTPLQSNKTKGRPLDQYMPASVDRLFLSLNKLTV